MYPEDLACHLDYEQGKQHGTRVLGGSWLVD